MHIIHKLYSEDFDFPNFQGAPRLSYMVATMPRSGSTTFVQHLWRTGGLGAPMEYPAMLNRRALYDRLSSSSWPDYWEKIQRLRTSPNGVFGYKMFVWNLLDVGRRQPDLYRAFNWTKIVYLTRNDILGQAISHSRALRSEAWFSGVPAKEIEYDGDHIALSYKSILKQRSFWEDVFRTTGATPVRVTYEDFLEDKDREVCRVASHLEVALAESTPIDIPLIDKQRDQTTNIWRSRFIEEGREAEILHQSACIQA